jgi:hypothetical protein
MTTNSFLGADVDLWDLAQRTKNFSGAELEGLVKSATSWALNRQVDVSDLSKPIDEENLKARTAPPPPVGFLVVFVLGRVLPRHSVQGDSTSITMAPFLS